MQKDADTAAEALAIIAIVLRLRPDISLSWARDNTPLNGQVAKLSAKAPQIGATGVVRRPGIGFPELVASLDAGAFGIGPSRRNDRPGAVRITSQSFSAAA